MTTMRRLRAWLMRIAGLFNAGRTDRELSDELRSHIEMHTEDNLRQGMNPAEARRDALIKLAGVDATKERYRDRRGIPWLEALMKDARFGVRILRRSPGFTAVAVITLGLGIGANTAIFSIVNAVLLRPLPYPDPGRLVMVWSTRYSVSFPDFEDWRSQATSFEGLAALTAQQTTLSANDHAETIKGIQVTAGFFELLGASPQLGRTFSKEDSEAGAPKVAMIGDHFWKSGQGGDPSVLGRTIRINEETYTVVGVLPAGFQFNQFGGPEQVCTPLIRDPDRGHGYLTVLGRLKQGVAIPQAQAEMDAITRRLIEQYHAKSYQGPGAKVESLIDTTVGNIRAGLWILMGVVAFVLLIACANVANLILSHGASRRKEIVVRAALGAGRARLAQQLFVESAILALAGGVLGLALANWGARLLVVLLSGNFPIPRIQQTGTDLWVIIFTLAISLATGIGFGVFPILSAISVDLNLTLNESGRSATEGPARRRIRGTLVVAETALALVLLASAGTLLRTFLAIRSTPIGFQPDNLVAVGFWLPRLKYSQPSSRRQFFGGVLEAAAATPGVRSAALIANLPLTNNSDGTDFHIVGRPDPEPGTGFESNFNIASAGYFDTMRIAVLAGREFTNQDGPGSPGVIVINQAAATAFWPRENPIGKQISMADSFGTADSGDKDAVLTIVGVAANVRQTDIGLEPKPEIFLNYTQTNQKWSWLTLLTRTDANPAPMVGGLRNLAQSVDPDVPVSSVRTMDQVFSNATASPRVYALLLGAFALLALILASVGIYGVVSYGVSQRTHEIGIRMALGAERADILKMVLRQGVGLTLAGTVIGIAGAMGATRLLTHIVESAKPGDRLTLIVTSAVLLAVSIAAALVPARRGTKVTPAVALRCE
jgi:predicted permease